MSLTPEDEAMVALYKRVSNDMIVAAMEALRAHVVATGRSVDDGEEWPTQGEALTAASAAAYVLAILVAAQLHGEYGPGCQLEAEQVASFIRTFPWEKTAQLALRAQRDVARGGWPVT